MFVCVCGGCWDRLYYLYIQSCTWVAACYGGLALGRGLRGMDAVVGVHRSGSAAREGETQAEGRGA